MCTGNICRSALAERLGRAFVADALGADGYLRLASAGTRAVVGAPMHADSAQALQGLGAAAGDFRARQLTEELAASADLVLTMTRDHRTAVLASAPRALARTFTLREAAALLPLVEDVDPAGGRPEERARILVRELAAARWQRPVGGDDDVRDPIGRSADVHTEVGERIADALVPVLTRLVGLTGRWCGEAGATPVPGNHRSP